MPENQREAGPYSDQYPAELGRDVIATVEEMEPGETITIVVKKPKGGGAMVEWEMRTDNPGHEIVGAKRRDFKAVKVPLGSLEAVGEVLEATGEQRKEVLALLRAAKTRG